MKKSFTSIALIAGLALATSASAQSKVTTYKKIKMCVAANQSQSGKASTVQGALNLDPDSKNVLFVVNESVQRTIPYKSISSLEFYMANHTLRILYRNGTGQDQYVDMTLPGSEQPDLLKQIQAQTGIAVRLT
jgi:hypothetical protein